MKILRQYIKDQELDGKKRDRHIHYKRCYLYAYIRKVYGFSLDRIGKEFNRNHATILNGIRVYERFKKDSLFLECTYEIFRKFPIGSSRVVYYTGEELKWSTDDIYVIAAEKYGRKLSQDAVEDILLDVFLKNKSIVDFIHQQILSSIDKYKEKELLQNTEKNKSNEKSSDNFKADMEAQDYEVFKENKI
jgi:hypothetical protein